MLILDQQAVALAVASGDLELFFMSNGVMCTKSVIAPKYILRAFQYFQKTPQCPVVLYDVFFFDKPVTGYQVWEHKGLCEGALASHQSVVTHRRVQADLKRFRAVYVTRYTSLIVVD